MEASVMTNPIGVEVGDTVVAEYETVLGEQVEHSFVVDRVGDDGVYSEYAVGERFVPFEGFTAEVGVWEVAESPSPPTQEEIEQEQREFHQSEEQMGDPSQQL